MVPSFNEPLLPLVAPPGDEDEAQPVALTGRLPSYIADHRQRLRDRFLQAGGGALPEYELLELVLFRPHRRPRGGARAPPPPRARPQTRTGPGPAVVLELKLVEAAAQRMMRARVIQKPLLSSWDALLDYCHTTMAHRETEQFRVLFLDRKNVLIADEEQAKGTVDHVPVYPREIVKRALALNASALILVHNHPSGDPTPSDADLSMTHQVKDACEALGLTLHDHLIIGKSRELSFRSQGYL